ncbi:ice-structuring protein 4-like isoform X2 [Osmia bicornis bicornis]|uniref:ice-structuring protein 4-like isoform X2 n=1 Tax=Osmia bicornis bicornis TaxID=1437191 RepID=UPI001EAF282E|nr:ice-structuring protein 4-like isoform X2 [Osmia bicornis bicornis]
MDKGDMKLATHTFTNKFRTNTEQTGGCTTSAGNAAAAAAKSATTAVADATAAAAARTAATAAGPAAAAAAANTRYAEKIRRDETRWIYHGTGTAVAAGELV